MKEWFQGLTCEDGKAERCRLRGIVFWVLVVVFAASLLYGLKHARGEEVPLHVLEKDGVEIRLMGTPCVDQTSIGLIQPAYLPRFRAIDSVWPERDGTRKRYAGCWMALTSEEAGGEEVFLLVFEDRATGAVPKSEFRKMRGQSGA